MKFKLELPNFNYDENELKNELERLKLLANDNKLFGVFTGDYDGELPLIEFMVNIRFFVTSFNPKTLKTIIKLINPGYLDLDHNSYFIKLKPIMTGCKIDEKITQIKIHYFYLEINRKAIPIYENIRNL